MVPSIDIRSFRTARGWSQEMLAEKLGVNVSTVWRWEKRSAPAKGPVVKAIERLSEEYPSQPERAA